ncbi:MAG: methyltransferase domain-containing protein [Actinobacteria bacterium]|nr:methyltransferase domain-containing protein [Chloroflexota bacterium]MBE3128675.1 methyltransferase domain-containing protein [Actinomycetota bacterium]
MNIGNLLELGLGHGYTIQQFLNSGKINYYRILEGSKEIIEKFKRDNSNINVDIKHIYFEDYESEDKFDNIVIGFILEHVDSPELIISKFKKHLKSNGKMFITVPNSEALNRRFGYESGLLKKIDYLSEEDKQLGHKRYFNKEKLLKMIESCGLKAKSIEGLFLKPITTEQIIKLNLSEEILMAMLKVGVHYPELCTGILIEAIIE